MKTKRKNIFKSLLALTIALIMVLGVAPLNELAGVDWASLFAPKAEAAGKTYGIYTYEVGKDGTITITDCDTSAKGAITIPSKIYKRTVTTIGKSAFFDCDSLTSIIIPNSVTSIEESAFFDCDSLTNITLPTITSIGTGTFGYCDSLTSITIPDGVTSIGDAAFLCCINLRNITIPDSVTSIGDAAFECCIDLKDVYYTGSKDEWKAISVGDYNADLLNATIHYSNNSSSQLLLSKNEIYSFRNSDSDFGKKCKYGMIDSHIKKIVKICRQNLFGICVECCIWRNYKLQYSIGKKGGLGWFLSRHGGYNCT